MRFRQVLHVPLWMLLASCASLVAQSPDDLLRDAHRSEPRCFDQSIAEIEERVRSYMLSCHRPYTFDLAYITSIGNATIATSHGQVRVNWKVEERAPAAGGKQFYARFDQGYTLGASVQATASCKASVQVFAANFGWKNRFDRIFAAANGENPGCLSQ